MCFLYSAYSIEVNSRAKVVVRMQCIGCNLLDLERRVIEGDESPTCNAARQCCHCLQRVRLFGNAAQSGW